MTLFIIALIAGFLTVLSPCVLPLLPIIVGGSLAGGTSFRRAITVTLSLGISVFLFTLLLKASTAFINVPPEFWNIFSGVLIIVVGLVMVFPKLWDKLPFAAKLNLNSTKAMSAGFMKKSFWGDILVGAALGPVFSTCSPTYFVVLATVLPVSLSKGIADILAYILGLCVTLLFISFVGQKIMTRLNIASDPNGWFKRVIGVLFIAIGLLIVTGLSAVVEAPLYNIFDETKIEDSLLSHNKTGATNVLVPTPGVVGSTTMLTMGTTTANGMPPLLTMAQEAALYPKAPELVSPDGYINTGGQSINLAQYRGKDVVLVDFWTYSCINCQREIPYLNAWYAKYKGEGFVIIGVSTPEFVFEHVESNVAAAVQKLGIMYPVVLDNEYKTWDAYGNEYWPQEYLVNTDGYIVYSHSGEGDYDVTEKAIQTALAEQAERLGQSTAGIDKPVTTIQEQDLNDIQSPETYFGSNRNEFLANGEAGQTGTQTFTTPATALQPNELYLGGSWTIQPEYAQTNDSNETIEYTYDAHDLYMVAAAATPVTIEVLRDGKPVGSAAGADVNPQTSTAVIQANRLYSLVQDTTAGSHTIEIKVMGAGLQAYTFTFG